MLNIPMMCRRLCIANGDPMMDATGPFRVRGVAAMSLLTELRITTNLENNNSLEELTALQNLAIDYGHDALWLSEPVFPLVVSCAARITELRITVHTKVRHPEKVKKDQGLES